MDKRSNADHNLCHFSYSDGRRCRMLRHRDHPGLCPFHSREERQRIESERIGTELAATLTGHYLTATDINHVLGKVFTALAQDRISIKKAKALSYLAQLMLHSLRGVRKEYQFKYDFEAWQRMLKNSVPLPDPLDPIEDDFVEDEFVDAAESEDVNVAPTLRSASDAAARDAGDHASSTSACRGDFTSPSASAAAHTTTGSSTHDRPSDVGAGFSPSPTAAGSAPLGVGPLGPTSTQSQKESHLSSPHPLAGSASACDDSLSDIDEDTTEEPAFAGAGSNQRRDS